jgi:hypothetical protein
VFERCAELAAEFLQPCGSADLFINLRHVAGVRFGHLGHGFGLLVLRALLRRVDPARVGHVVDLDLFLDLRFALALGLCFGPFLAETLLILVETFDHGTVYGGRVPTGAALRLLFLAHGAISRCGG